jgi:NADPH:quinone reductase-like Zn-dependent oxidoreductase
VNRGSKYFASDLQQLFEWLKDGRIYVPIKNTFRLDEIQAAHRAYASSERMGSIVIEVSR